MSTSNDPQQYLDQLEAHFESDRFYPYALAVQSASERINRALDPFSSTADTVEDAIEQAKAEIRALAEG